MRYLQALPQDSKIKDAIDELQYISFLFFFFFFSAMPPACRTSQERDQTRATAMTTPDP